LLGRVLELALATLIRPLLVAAQWTGKTVLRVAQAVRRRLSRTPGDAPATNQPAAEPAAEPAAGTAGGTADATGGPGWQAAAPPLPAASDRERPALSLRSMWRIAAGYVLAVLAWVVATVLRRVDSALQQMGVGDSSGGSALGFPVSWSDLTETLRMPAARTALAATHAAWEGYRTDVSQPTVLRNPFAVAQSMVVLDFCFIVLYSILFTVVLVGLYRLNSRTGGSAVEEQSRLRRSRILYGGGFALALLFLVDLVENVELERALVLRQPPAPLPFDIALGPLMSLLKLPLAVGMLVPMLFVAFVLAAQSRPLRKTLLSVRGALYAVGGLFVLLMFGMGAAQADDVIRAWDGWRALWAVFACVALSVTVYAVTRYLSSGAREQPAPDVGRRAQPLLLGTGVLLILIGQVLRLGGLGWGLSVAGGIFVVLWALGLPVDGLPKWRTTATRRPPGAAVLAVTGIAGGVVGAVLAVSLDAAVPLGIVLGAVLALAALAAWWLWSAGQTATRHDEGPGASDLRAGRVEADLAVAACNAAVRAALDEDMAAWSGHAQAAATHAARTKRHADDAQAAGADTVVAAGLVASAGQAEVTAREAVDARMMAVWGDRLGRLAGAAVAAIVVVMIARAIALDAYIREPANWDVIRWPFLGAVAAGLGGLVVCAYPTRDPGDENRWLTVAWLGFTAAAFGSGLFLLQDAYAITGAQAAGSVSLLLGGFTILTGALALLAALIRRGPLTQYALAPALRTLHFTRFPVLAFLVVWVVAVSALDSGGFHDIRRYARPTSTVPPTIGQAWQQYVQAVPAGGARPVILVAAQGGGIRAAVWTALVLECVFGPGPVARSGPLCAAGEGVPDPALMAGEAAKPLPVFLASGASGGSVGLAAWTARRADLVLDGPTSTTPRVVERALDRDFVAPDVARLLLADIPHAFLAWNRADRAEMLERAWEQPWQTAGAPPHGLARGLRETWEVTHAGGTWATPVLALNGASVEDGCRFVASAVDFTLPREFPATPADVATAVDATDDRPDDAACRGVDSGTAEAVDILPSTNELIDYLCSTEDVPLSTAAHISARFPYVSPTGRIDRRQCTDEVGLVPDPAISYDADGGIFDNSGAGTAVDAWRALAPLAAATERQAGTCLVPIFLQIDNSPPAATVSSAADPRPDELTAPIGATLGQISSRDRYARASAAAAFGQPVSAAGLRVLADAFDRDGHSPWFRIALYGQPGPEPPLGWTLAPETVDDMRSQLRALPNQREIQALRSLLREGAMSCQR